MSENKELQTRNETTPQTADEQKREPVMLLRPNVDIVERAEGIDLWADLPGVDSEHLDIEVDNDALTITGDIVLEAPEDLKPLHADVRTTRYQRRFSLGKELETDRIEAKLKDGVLHLFIPKAEAVRPRKIEDLKDGVIEVIAGTSHERLLQRLREQYPWLNWRANRDMGTEELIELVDQGVADYMLGDSHEIALQRRFFPELRIAFELGKPKLLRWAYKRSEDHSLDKAVRQFFDQIRNNGQLEQLIHRYYSHVARFNYSDIQTFLEHAKQRLPKYRGLFEKIARQEGLEWQLLAAIGYQESLWNEKAKSPTGVRGLMMLTRNTARHVGIKNRLDPEQSVLGGARYFKQVLKKIPERIPQPDRTWLALAAYNVGFGHLEDARKITEMNDGDPDKWIDVKKSLPLLSRKKWYKKTKHGYARGYEPVKYVENIRKYYELLVWMDKRAQGEDTLPDLPERTEDLKLPPSF